MESPSKSETIANLVEGLPRLRVYDEEIGAFEDKMFVSTIPVADKNTYLGIEVETENVQIWHQSGFPYWKITEDGSLRNSGREFITVPIKAFRAENALTTLFKYQINSDIEFTERTSIHVHMNVRTLTLDQLRAMILLYILFEKALFRYVHKDRYNNIFCVPLTETNFGEKLINLFHSNTISLSWMKYTALNLLPIWEKGTIEFRHLHGTKDIPEIMGWINLILCLKKMALRTDPKIIWETIESLNTSSQYHAYASEVFGTYITNLDENYLEKDIASCCTYIKAKCFKNSWVSDLLVGCSKESPLYKFSASGRVSDSYVSFEDVRVDLNDSLNTVSRGVWTTTVRTEARDQSQEVPPPNPTRVVRGRNRGVPAFPWGPPTIPPRVDDSIGDADEFETLRQEQQIRATQARIDAITARVRNTTERNR